MLINEKVYSFQVKITGILLGVMVVLLGLYDYQFNYKKGEKFKISPSMLIVLNLITWIFEGSYLFISINLMLLIIFILWKKNLNVIKS